MGSLSVARVEAVVVTVGLEVVLGLNSSLMSSCMSTDLPSTRTKEAAGLRTF